MLLTRESLAHFLGFNGRVERAIGQQSDAQRGFGVVRV